MNLHGLAIQLATAVGSGLFSGNLAWTSKSILLLIWYVLVLGDTTSWNHIAANDHRYHTPVQMSGVFIIATRALHRSPFIHVLLDNEFTSFPLPQNTVFWYYLIIYYRIALVPATVMFESWFQLKAILWKNWLQKRTHFISKLMPWFNFAFDHSYGSVIQAFWLRSCYRSYLWSSWSWSSPSPRNISRQM